MQSTRYLRAYMLRYQSTSSCMCRSVALLCKDYSNKSSLHRAAPRYTCSLNVGDAVSDLNSSVNRSYRDKNSFVYSSRLSLILTLHFTVQRT